MIFCPLGVPTILLAELCAQVYLGTFLTGHQRIPIASPGHFCLLSPIIKLLFLYPVHMGVRHNYTKPNKHSKCNVLQSLFNCVAALKCYLYHYSNASISQ